MKPFMIGSANHNRQDEVGEQKILGLEIVEQIVQAIEKIRASKETTRIDKKGLCK